MKSKAAQFLLLSLAASLIVGSQSTSLTAKSNEFVTTQPQGTDQAGTAFNEGRRLLRRGRADLALIQLQKALDLYTASKNNHGIAKANNEIGDLYLRQGQFQVALDHYKKALEGFVDADKKNAEAASAASAVDSRLANANIADDKFNANLMLAKIGDVNFRLKRNSEALAAYGQMDIKKPEGAATKATRRFGGMGAIVGGLSTGKPSVGSGTSALTVAMEAKKELDEYRTSIVYASYQLGMGRISYANGDLDGAKKYFEAARDASGVTIAGIANLGQTRRFRAAARTSVGDVALKQGKLKDAKDSYTLAIKGAQDDKRLDLTWPAQRGLGRTLWLQAAQEKDVKKATSMRETALGNYRDAIKTIETLREGSLRADEARTTFLASTKDVFDEASSTMAEMALLTASSAGGPLDGKALEYGAEAFRISEESRARSLLDLLSEIGGAITEGVPAELLKQKQDNLDRQQEIAEILTGVNISTDEQKKKPSELDAELDKLQTDYEALENQIRTASPRYAALSSNQPLTLADVQQKVLDDQTVLLEYSLGTDASYMWVISKASTGLYKLPPKTAVDKLAIDLRGQLVPEKLQRRIVGIDVAAQPERGLGIASAPQEAGPFVTASRALYQAVIEPAASVVGEKRLLIVADGALNYVPFEVLVKTAEGSDYSALPYLIKSNELVYAPSASAVAAIRQQRTKPAGRAMLIVADPVFNSNDPRASKAAGTTATAETRGLGIESALTDITGQGAVGVAQSSKMQGLPLARLAGTRTEADQISKLAKSSGGQADVWLDLDASEDNLDTRSIANYRVVHIATHGLLDADRPQFTGVVLSLVGNKNADGFLRTDEVFNLRLGSPLVMLSACETGLGKEKRGEGVMGLTRAFMYAGAPTVGVSLWSVADKSTADLMTDFYKRYLAADDVSPSAAMRNAQLAMIAGKKYSAPFFWAPFVLVGDWR